MAASNLIRADLRNDNDVTRPFEQYLEMWTHAVLAAKSVRASVTIVGPSIPGFDLEFLKLFLDNANKTDTFPDVVSWHEFGADGSNIPANVEAARNLVSTYVQGLEE